MDWDTEGGGGLIVCNPGVIITYDPFSILGSSRRAGCYSQSTLKHFVVCSFNPGDAARWIWSRLWC